MPDDFDAASLLAAAEAITGPMDAPDTGALFVLPVSQVYGLDRRES